MAKKISQLDNAGPLGDFDMFEVVQSGVSKRIYGSQLTALAASLVSTVVTAQDSANTAITKAESVINIANDAIEMSNNTAGALSTISSIVTSANSKADSALNSISNVLSRVQTAEQLSTTASTDAALAKANFDDFLPIVGQLVDDTASAITIANGIAGTANDAFETAGEASDVANQADDKADDALAKANSAISIATPLPALVASAQGDAAEALTRANAAETAVAGKQNALGYTPVQQGGAGAQTTTKVYIGALSGTTLGVQIGSTDFASNWPINSNSSTKLATARTIAGVSFDGTANIVLTKSNVGLTNVDNTSDVNKPVSTAQAASIATRIASTEKGAAGGVAPLGEDMLISPTYLPSYVDDVLEFDNFASLPTTGERGKIYITTDNNTQYRWSGSVYIILVASPGTSDAVPEGNTNKYYTDARTRAAVLTGYAVGTNTILAAGDTVLSAFQKVQGQINARALIASPTFTGVPLAPTATAGTSTTQIATTSFVMSAISTFGVGTVTSVNTVTPNSGNVSLGIGNIPNLQDSLDAKAPLVSPALSGAPTAPTASTSTNTTQIATTAFVKNVAASLGTVTSVNNVLPTAGNVSIAMVDIPGLSSAIASAGSVKTVAGKSPNASGEVSISPADIGAEVAGTAAGMKDVPNGLAGLNSSGVLTASVIPRTISLDILQLNRSSGNAAIEIGSVSGSATSPIVDFHSGATAVDYDFRMMATGGTGSIGGGSLSFLGQTFDLTGVSQVLATTRTAGDNSQKVATTAYVDSAVNAGSNSGQVANKVLLSDVTHFTAGTSTSVQFTPVLGFHSVAIVSLDGLIQFSNSYTLSSNTITFTEAIPSGTKNIEITYFPNTTEVSQYVNIDQVTTLLSGKANTAHTHSLSNLTQSGAINGQSPVWNGSAWAPANVQSSGGSIPIGGYLSFQADWPDLTTFPNLKTFGDGSVYLKTGVIADLATYPLAPYVWRADTLDQKTLNSSQDNGWSYSLYNKQYIKVIGDSETSNVSVRIYDDVTLATSTVEAPLSKQFSQVIPGGNSVSYYRTGNKHWIMSASNNYSYVYTINSDRTALTQVVMPQTARWTQFQQDPLNAQNIYALGYVTTGTWYFATSTNGGTSFTAESILASSDYFNGYMITPTYFVMYTQGSMVYRLRTGGAWTSRNWPARMKGSPIVGLYTPELFLIACTQNNSGGSGPCFITFNSVTGTLTSSSPSSGGQYGFVKDGYFFVGQQNPSISNQFDFTIFQPDGKSQVFTVPRNQQSIGLVKDEATGTVYLNTMDGFFTLNIRKVTNTSVSLVTYNSSNVFSAPIYMRVQ